LRLTRLLLAAYLIVAGISLVIAPWLGDYWERNWFAAAMPALQYWMANDYVRGAVSGIGVVTTLVGLRDWLVLLFGPSPNVPRHTPEPPAP
jgi:hypothetical protein